jgi:hypothetical protein
MAKRQEVSIQKSVRGQPLEVFLGNLPGVQRVVQARAKEIEANAEEILQPHRYTGATEIRLDRMRTSRGLFAKGYVVTLIDTASGREGNIEVGRKPQLIETDPRVALKGARTTSSKAPRQANGKYGVVRRFTVVGQPYGGMDGLFILTKAVRAVRARHRREFR